VNQVLRLPIIEIFPELEQHLESGNTIIIEAPPGAGKSTLLPLFLLKQMQKIIMLEPRRLAARSVANRMASLLGEKVGQRIGYQVRFEKVLSSQTELVVLTEGLLTRRLQDDPTLEGINCIIFDEFHERSLHADLALALCREIQRELRPDLKIIIMSATLDSQNLSGLLNAPIIRAEGRSYPIEIRYAPRELETPIPNRVAQSVYRALEIETGDILAFLPGAGEILRCMDLLDSCDAVVLPLYGELSLEAQTQAILPDPQGRRKIVLATSIAETSLTIEGVRIVIDSGVARVPKFDPQSSLTRLETVRVTSDAATQRAGRSGRTQAGIVYRLWTQSQQAGLEKSRKPEILESDLAPLCLELAAWGATQLDWVTLPNAAALEKANDLLYRLGALENNRITKRGQAMLRFPAHPRLAHLALEAQALGLAPLAADVAAILEERDFLESETTDLGTRVEALRAARSGQRIFEADKQRLNRVERVAEQWAKLLKTKLESNPFNHADVGKLVALAYPDRIAQLRTGESRKYKLALGRGVQLPPADLLQGTPYLAIAQLDAGTEEGKVFLCAPLETQDLKPFSTTFEALRWDTREGTLIARTETRIGEIILDSKPLQTIPIQEKNRVLCNAIRSNPNLLEWSDHARAYQAQVQSLHVWRGEPFPDFTDLNLLKTLEIWLAPHLEPVRRQADFARLELRSLLEQNLPWETQRQIDILAPAKIQVPSGSQIRLEYNMDGSAPILAVRLQEVFGLLETPKVNDGRTPVLLHLLSPAYRPVQVTQDLSSFWKNTYPVVRQELKRKYPKHSWAEDPYTAQAVRGAVKRHLS
jgi:ATP-dependent helicase HrpB